MPRERARQVQPTKGITLVASPTASMTRKTGQSRLAAITDALRFQVGWSDDRVRDELCGCAAVGVGEVGLPSLVVHPGTK